MAKILYCGCLFFYIFIKVFKKLFSDFFGFDQEFVSCLGFPVFRYCFQSALVCLFAEHFLCFCIYCRVILVLTIRTGVSNFFTSSITFSVDS